MKILILGGGGYVGSLLTEMLLEQKKNEIRVVDTFWFGNNLKKNKRLEIIKKDIREADNKWFKGIDSIIHLANIANDPAVDLNPNLSWDVNVIASIKIMKLAIKNKINKFIFASSGSVYGVKKEKKVTEDCDLDPISVYNKTKMVAERIFMSYKDKIRVNCIRPATVCGISPRMRFDITVNLLTLHALKKKQLTVFGGNQVRPNIHIKDMIRVYEHILTNDIEQGIYNAGFENVSILELGKKIKNKINCELEIIKSNDPRSYRQCSDKLIKTGFKQKFYIDDAINEIRNAFYNENLIDDDSCYTVNWMKDKVLNG